jgi:hypothetical protein
MEEEAIITEVRPGTQRSLGEGLDKLSTSKLPGFAALEVRGPWLQSHAEKPGLALSAGALGTT